jgi:aminopeptidase N
MSKQSHIVAIGGRAFADTKDPPLFEKYILKLTGKKTPRIAFLPTASGDSSAYIARFYATFARLDCKALHVPLFGRTPDLKKILLNQDAIFVGGGNTKSMLAAWSEWGVQDMLRDAAEKGIVLAGTSAGAICWFEQGVTDSWEKDIKILRCMGMIDGSCCPHYSGEAERIPAVKKLLKSGNLKSGIALDDGAAAHFVDGKLKHIVTTSKKSHAYEIALRGKSIVEKKLPSKQLSW